MEGEEDVPSLARRSGKQPEPLEGGAQPAGLGS